MAFDIDFVDSYDKHALIRELRRIAESLGKSTISRRDIDARGRISSSVVLKRFGSLRKALQESGLTPMRFNKATDEELYAMLVDLWTQTLTKYGRSPYRTELKTFGFPVSGDTFVRRFGSWNNALLAQLIRFLQTKRNRSNWLPGLNNRRRLNAARVCR